MLFVRQKLSVILSYTLLVLFCGMGLVESLHHHVLDETSCVSIAKDGDGASLQKYQPACELCKAIANHQHLYQPNTPDVSIQTINFADKPLTFGVFAEDIFDNSFHSYINKGPPCA